MIVIRAEVRGEPDVPPFTRVFEYLDESDEEIFYGSIKIIKEKLSKKLRVNTNESLALYCGYVVDELRAHKSTDTIEKNAPIILSENVMIGVPETLRTISFEVILDNIPKKKITLHEPIPTSYTMADR
ncbi:MAG: urease subunit gamma [Candidatus Nitrosopolaris sp.]|jgi:urease gamma subunit